MIMKAKELAIEKHIKFFQRNLQLAPNAYQSFASNHMTLVFFCLAGLEILGALDATFDTDEKRRDAIDWIYGFQVIPKDASSRGGFRGGRCSGFEMKLGEGSKEANANDTAHIANTYAALACLVLLRDDLSRVHKQGVVQFLKECRQADGSFAAAPNYSEKDMRFVYCACASSHIINDWKAIDMKQTMLYIRNSTGYDYGIGQGPNLESHGGSTYCALASLNLMNKLNVDSEGGLVDREKTIEWCLMRQISGFQGRRNKDADSCYSFWIGASLKMLDAYDMVDFDCVSAFLMETETSYGGISKVPGYPPDMLHSFLGLVGYSLANPTSPLTEWDVAVNVSCKSLQDLHSKSPSGV